MSSYLEERRNNLFALMQDNSVALVFAGASKVTSEDELYPFKVNPNFFYLTDIEQENSVILLVKSVNGNFTYLFVDEYSELKEKWTGKRLRYEEAREISSINNVDSTNSFEAFFNMVFTKINNQYGNITKLYIDQPFEQKLKDNLFIKDFVEACSKSPILDGIEIANLREQLTILRMVKRPEEIDFITHAVNNTQSGLLDLYNFVRPGMVEYAVSDRFEYYEKSHFHEGLAFSTIAAGGKNATCLHYPQQKDDLNANDLLLLDLGYKYHHYSADITRTIPISGSFTEIQKKVYSVVLACNKAVIEYSRSGLTLKDLQDFASNFMRDKAIEVGLMKPDEDIKKYYYHNVSHHLGLDTHDICDRSIPLQAGNVITVEPGLYFANLGIGVRIEDDILITDNKSVVLTKNVVKEIEDIEKLLRSKK